MSRIVMLLAVVALTLGNAGPALAQVSEVPEVPADQRVRRLPRQHLSGPRFGFTTFTGDVARQRQQAGLQPIMTQFGWQFETQIVSLNSRNQALLEMVVLLGGFEQSEINLSGTWLAGYRMENGFEFGVGPSIGFNPDREDISTSMIVAAGMTMPFGDLYVPFNVAVAMAEGGPRITTLMGWVVG